MELYNLELITNGLYKMVEQMEHLVKVNQLLELELLELDLLIVVTH